MNEIEKLMESARNKLNCLLRNREIITDDKKLLELSIELDVLINQYLHNQK